MDRCDHRAFDQAAETLEAGGGADRAKPHTSSPPATRPASTL